MLDAAQVWALEVNPRLSASFDLYDIPELFDWHVHACQGELPDIGVLPLGCRAQLIYYATHNLSIGSVAWPEWVTDTPPEGALCRAGDPVCSIQATGDGVAQTRILAFARAQQLEAQLQGLQFTNMRTQ
jgi:predicted ATP-grasp superfamily ATP-dependent carboligase